MKLPETIKICGFDWKIVQSDPIAREGSVFGSCHYATQTIYLDPTTTDQKKKQCLLHEIMHAVFWQTGLTNRLTDQKKLEEEIVTALSFGMYQVLSDNGLLTGFGEERSKE